MSVLDVTNDYILEELDPTPVLQKENLNITISTDIYELDFEETDSLIIPTTEEKTAKNDSTSK